MSWLSRLKHLVNPRALDDALDEELRDHLERREADLIRDGLSPGEARRQARRLFGNVTAVREDLHRIKTAVALETALREVRLAWRSLWRRPVFALTALLSVGLSAGATIAVYALVDAAILRPLPVPDPGRLVVLSTPAPAGGAGAPSDDQGPFSYPLYAELGRAAGDASRLALFEDLPRLTEVQADGTQGASETVQARFVSPNAFGVLGVAPEVGRLFSPADDHYPSPRLVVVLSHDYWVNRFGSDASVIGRSILVSGRPHTIIGVAPQGFHGVEPGTFIDLWRPITTFDPSVFTNPAIRVFRVMARLGPSTTPEQLSARLQPTFHEHQLARLATEGGSLSTEEQRHLRSMPLLVSPGQTGVSAFRHTFGGPLWLLFALAFAILLVACANVAGLAIARWQARADEVALCLALGATRVRLFRRFMVEGAMLAVAGVAGGWVVGRLLANELVGRVSTSGHPVRLDLRFDGTVLAIAAGLCVLATFVIGALPARQMLARQAASAVPRIGRRFTRRQMGRGLVTVQVMFAFGLLMTGAAFVVSLRNLTGVSLGFDASNVTVLTMANDAPQFATQRQLAQQLQARIGDLPDVQGAATAWYSMFSGEGRMQRVSLPGEALSERTVTFYRVSPRFLDTLRIPLLRGRDFDDRDDDTEPVASIVNMQFARTFLHTEAPLGRSFLRDDGVRHVVVGIAADARYAALRGGDPPIVYMPMKPPRVFTLYVRSALVPSALAQLVAREARTLGFGLRVRDVTTLGAQVASTIVTERLLSDIGAASAFAGLAIGLVGLFGLLNYVVTERTPEIGIRMALGAARRGVYVLVLREAAGPVLFGLLAGAVASLLTLRWSRSLLFDVSASDVRVVALALGAFLGAALVACAIPARRAAAIDPIVAVRHK